MIELGANRYGKSAIRLVKIVRGPDRHAVRDLTVAIALEGDFASSYVEGDNSLVVATDTMKNTVYAFAREHLTGRGRGVRWRAGPALPAGAPRSSGRRSRSRSTAGARSATRPTRSRGTIPRRRTASVSATRESVTFGAGIADLTLMKTAKSAFAGFPRDEYTTLPDTDDRLMATKLSAVWQYAAETDYDESFGAISRTLLDVFAEHRERVRPALDLDRRPGDRRSAPRGRRGDAHPAEPPPLARRPQPFGQPNDREIFIATTEPHGLIQATVKRGDKVPHG